MQLSEVFGARNAQLIASASAVDEGESFRRAVSGQPLDAVLGAAVRRASARFAALAGIEDGVLRSGAFGGQQPYVDYYPAVPAKLDPLEECGGFYGFADYAAFGSDPWMARTELPSVTAAGGMLRLVFHRPLRAHAGKDLRFVPPPSAATLADVVEKLKGMISATARVVPLPRKAAFARLRLLLDDYSFARERATSAGAFNAIWSARTFRRLGLAVPLVSLAELLGDEALLPAIAETLSLFIRERRAVADCVAEALADDPEHALHFTPKATDHVPLALADGQGIRQPVRFDGERLVCDGVRLDAGDDAASLEAFLRKTRGSWSLDVFAPLFLFRLGVTGIVNGRGSIRYSLVLAQVQKRLFETVHPPNLLCSCNPPPTGPFAEAVRRTCGEEAVRDWEPTLIARLLCDEPAVIRREIAESWR
ncbi:MAG: hypothetical protein QOH21_374 [Acidobacteriota bacterium]|jgi:hypothetical protein|nr:hypothetical protein [Acidobacteriota bacterium]